MTKLKNTKKGMAKKALSISLVAAMLATSNVPVWAAEFTDGTDAVVEAPVVEEAVDTFSAEAEAPVVEEEVNDVATYASTAEYDFSDVTIKKNTPWKNATAVLGGTIKKDGTNITAAENLKFKWVLGGVQQTGEADASNLAGGSGIAFTKDAIGQKLEAIFYVEGKADDVIAKLDLGTVQAMDIAEEFSISKINDQTYNGKEPKDATITLTAKNWSSFSAYATQCGVTGTAETWFSYDYNSTKGANAGSVVTVTAKLKDDVAAKLGYTGSVSTDYNITKCTWLDVNDVDITINNTSAGEYTGNKIELPGSAATVKLKDTDIELPIEKVVTKSAAAGDSVEVQVYYDTAAMNATKNFELSKGWEHTASTKVSIAKRDLSKVNAKLNVTYTVENVSSSKFAIKPERLTITDADNNVLNLKNDINVTLKSGTYDKPGTYEDAIVITAKTANCVNKTYADLVVTKKNFDADKATFKNADKVGLVDYIPSDFDAMASAVEYQGTEFKFTEKQLGDFLPKGNDGESDNFSFNITYGNNTNASTKGNLATITVTGKTGSDYEGCSKTFYFKIKPATVRATTDSKTNTVTTAVKDTVKGVEVVAGAKAEDYKEAIGLAMSAKNNKHTEYNPEVDTFTLEDGTDYTCEYSFVSESKSDLGVDDDKNVAGQFVKVVATVKNTNYKVADDDVTGAKNAVELDGNSSKNTVTVYVPLVEKTIASAEIKLEKDSYVYTGENIIPKVTVTVGGKTLVEDKDYEVNVKNGIDVGTATVVVTALKGSGYRPGSQITKDFTITKANAADLTVTIINKDDIRYNGKAWNDGEVKYTIKLGDHVFDNSLFKATWGENISAGKTAGKLTLTPKTTAAKNFDGSKEVTFEIKGTEVYGTLKIYDANGKDITTEVSSTKYFYSGSPITFDKVVFTGSHDGKKLVEGKDYEIVYVNNTDAGTGYVTVVGKGNFVGSGEIKDGDTVLQDNVIKTAVGGTENKVSFTIIGSKFTAKDITVKNGTYASGLVVKPQVTVVSNGETLVEGIDYKLVYDTNKAIDATTEANIRLTVKGIHKYNGVSIDKDVNGKYLTFGIDKFDLANASVTSDGKTVTVRNGNVVVPSTEYTSEIKDGKATVTATTDNKNYTGTKTVDVTKEDTFVEAPVIKEVKVVGNKATVVLEDDCDGATGYDYVISTNGQSSDAKRLVNKNVLATDTTFQYLQQGIYWAHCHAWKKVDGKKVFSAYSEAYPFSVTAITPDQPSVTSIKVSKNTVKVTYTKSKDATGYDLVLGKSMKKVNGEMRPVEYGKLVKKVYNGNTVTATFTKVPKGTYYVGLHAYNRTSEDGKKVFSPWSNAKKVVVK